MNRKAYNAFILTACAVSFSFVCCAILGLLLWIYSLNLSAVALAYIICGICGAIYGVVFVYPRYQVNPFMPTEDEDGRY